MWKERKEIERRDGGMENRIEGGSSRGEKDRRRGSFEHAHDLCFCCVARTDDNTALPVSQISDRTLNGVELSKAYIYVLVDACTKLSRHHSRFLGVAWRRAEDASTNTYT